MKSLESNGYSADAVRTALHAGERHVAFTYELLTNANVRKAWITQNVISGSVENNSLADINRTAKFVIKDPGNVNWLSDRIRPYIRFRMPDGGWVEWPLGIFLLASPVKSISTLVTREVEAYDQNLILVDDKFENRYRVAAGTNVVTAILAVLTSAGITQVNHDQTAETFPVDREWEPGTSKRKVVNDMLGMINFRSIYFNSNGFAILQAYQRPDQRPSEYTYETTEHGSVINPTLSQQLDLFSVANKWSAVVSEPDRTVLTSSYTNTSPTSPTSTVSRGRTIVDSRTGVEATSQAALDAIVQSWAFEASQIYETVNFQTALMPHHEDADLLTLSHPDVGAAANYVEHTWAMDLMAGAQMSHSVRRVVTV